MCTACVPRGRINGIRHPTLCEPSFGPQELDEWSALEGESGTDQSFELQKAILFALSRGSRIRAPQRGARKDFSTKFGGAAMTGGAVRKPRAIHGRLGLRT